MPLTIPPELKRITQFIRRAEELDRDKAHPESRIVAYYCRQYAVQLGITLSNTPASRTCLGEILSALEEEKEAMGMFTKDESYMICKKFAFKVFDRADAQDRAGQADKGTARTFYASATFLEILGHFQDESEEPVETEEDEKRVYAKWKATEILKAIKEGRAVTPGGYGENEMNDENSDVQPPVVYQPPAFGNGNGNGNETGAGTEIDLSGMPQETFESAPIVPTNDIPPPILPENNPPTTDDFNPSHNSAIPSAPDPSPTAISAITESAFSSMINMMPLASNNNNKSFRVSNEKLNDAIELTRFALAALEDRDVQLGTSRLQQALSSLGK